MRVGDLDAFRGYFEPKALYFSRAFRLGGIPHLTSLITLVNLAVFLLALRRGSIDAGVLLDFGAKAGPLLSDLGEAWRLLTANFIHRDWGHLGFNLFILFHFGAAVENAYRRADFLMIVFAAALGTTTLSSWMTGAISAGASGIGYGMLGSTVVFGIKYRRILPRRYRSVLGSAVLPTVLIFLYIGWVSSGVDNWGHLGGLLAGALATLPLRPKLLGDPPSARALLLTRALPFILVVSGSLLAPTALAGWFPRLTQIRSEHFGLELGVPSTWARQGELVFDNGLPTAGRASLAVGVRGAGEFPNLAAAAAEFIEGEFQPKVEEERIRDLVVGKLRYAHVGGMLGVAQEIGFVADETELVVTIHLFARGSVLYDMILVRPSRLPGYDEVFEKILRSVTPIEPAFAARARARVEAAPEELEGWLALADAERQIGNVAQARLALERAQGLAPWRWDVLARLASLSFLEGLGRNGCMLAARARQEEPEHALTLLAWGECALSEGDRGEARALFLAALDADPDPMLRARIERHLSP